MRQSEIPITDTYEDVRALIHHLVYRFQQRRGGDHDELVSVANLAFLRVYRAFDRKRASFNTLLGLTIYRELWKHQKRRELVTVNVGEMGWILNREYQEFNLGEFIQRVTDDAKVVLRIIFDPGDVLDGALEADGVYLKRQAIRNYLRKQGWSPNRIRLTFQTIRKELGNVEASDS